MAKISMVEEDIGITGHLKWCKASSLFASPLLRSLISKAKTFTCTRVNTPFRPCLSIPDLFLLLLDQKSLRKLCICLHIWGTLKNRVDISILISRSERNQGGIRIILPWKSSDVGTYFLMTEHIKQLCKCSLFILLQKKQVCFNSLQWQVETYPSVPWNELKVCIKLTTASQLKSLQLHCKLFFQHHTL